MKHIPNGISILRLFLSVWMAFLEPFTAPFMTLYTCCGISDVLDGYIARKMNLTSKLGQVLDSTADFVFWAVVLTKWFNSIHLPNWLIGWMALIAGLRMATLIYGSIKYRQIPFLHTYGNKLTGILIFLFPFGLFITALGVLGGILCAVATIASVEEFFLVKQSPILNRDVPSIIKR